MSAGRTALLALLAILLAGCGEVERVPDADLLVRVAAAKTSVRPGEGIPLTVTRVWRASHEPAPWDDAFLEPLVLRDERVERREAGGRIQETRRYRAYVFRREDVRVPEVVFASRPKAGGAVAWARSTPIELRVVPEVDADDPGAPELPGAAPPAPPPAWLWAFVLGLLVAGFELVAWRHRRAGRLAAEARRLAPSRALHAIRKREASEPAEVARDLVATLDAVRDAIAWRTGVPARARTREEIHGLLAGEGRAAYEAMAAPVEASKYAGTAPTAAVLRATVDRALTFVEGDAGGAREKDGRIGGRP